MTPKPYIAACPQRTQKTPIVYPAGAALIGRRTIIEVGPGRGDFLFHLAEHNPNAAVVGIEIKRKRVDKLIVRAEKRALANVRIIQDDARAALPRFFPDASVDEIHILFPDPWPKNRHEKNRAVSIDLLHECQRILKPDGTVSIATDDHAYAEDVRRSAATIAELTSAYPDVIVHDKPDAYPTYFSMKWKAEGRVNTYQMYRKAPEKIKTSTLPSE